MALGCAAALLTFLIHGVLDMFLEYTATNLLLWALIGALGSLAPDRWRFWISTISSGEFC